MILVNLVPLTHALSLLVAAFFDGTVQSVTEIGICGSLLLMVYLLPLPVTDWQHLQASPTGACGWYESAAKADEHHRGQGFN